MLALSGSALQFDFRFDFAAAISIFEMRGILQVAGARVMPRRPGPRSLCLGHLGLALVDRDAHLGVEVARRGDGEVELGDLDALVTVVLDRALQGVVTPEHGL